MLVTLTVQSVNFHFLIYELIYLLSIYFLIYLFIYLFIYSSWLLVVLLRSTAVILWCGRFLRLDLCLKVSRSF